MPITTLLGLSFGVVPCLLFGFIMLLSLLICEYIEEYVAKHLCAWKNRRRRGLRSFYRDYRDRRNTHINNECAQQWSSRNNCQPTNTNCDGDGMSSLRALPFAETVSVPSAPPHNERALQLYGAQGETSRSPNPFLPLDDSPPSYEECVLPRIRLQSRNGNGRGQNEKPNAALATSKPTKSKKSTGNVRTD